MSDKKRPNFLLIITDQHRADYLGCAGHPVLRTPHIDSIAARGIRFNRFYVSNPVCMPNRSTLMTGRMPSLHGVRHNGIPLSLQANTFVDLLRAEGYRTALVGKSHLQNMTSGPTVMTRRIPARDDGFSEAMKAYPLADGAYEQERPWSWAKDDFAMAMPFYGFEEVKLCTMHGDLVDGEYRHWLRAQRPDADLLIGAKNSLPHDYVCPQAWRTAVPEELYSTRYIENETLGWLDRHAASGDDDPFFLMVSFPDPHHPFTPPGKYWDMYDPADMALPSSFDRIGNRPPPTVSWVYDNRVEGKMDRSEGQFMFVVNEREAREAIALTCGMIAMIDDAVGSVLARLEALGLADDTVVVFTSDHGDFLGDHRLMLKGQIHYQGLIRVPFLVSDPAVPQRGAETDALCGTLDIAATVLDRAGVTPYNGIQGRSLLPEVQTLDDHGSGQVLIEDDQQRTVLGFSGSFRVHSLITERWRLSLYNEAEVGELYDLVDDPDEMDNLWDDPRHRDVKAALLEAFARRRIELVDRSPFPTAIA
jgi:arylsulfatase A-like enzyme